MKTNILSYASAKRLFLLLVLFILFAAPYRSAGNSNRLGKKIELGRLVSTGNLKEQLQQHVAKLTCYHVKPTQLEQFRKVLADYVNYSLSNGRNIMSEAYYERENPNILWLIERWDDKSELDRLANTTQAKALATLTKQALLKPAKSFYVKDLEPISKQQWRTTAKKEDDQLTIMLFVDAKAGTEAKFKDVYHVAMPKFRSEPGVITYQLSQIENDQTQFVTYEKFRSNEAFQYHLKFPPIQPVIDYLNTSIKKQPFQDGIHNLIEFAPLSRDKN